MSQFAQQLRQALTARLGQTLTPEVCAWIEASSSANRMPLPNAVAGVDVSQGLDAIAFINQKIGAAYSALDSVTLAMRDSTGAIKACVLFSYHQNHCIEMAVASDGSGHWITKNLLRASFEYPFKTLGVSCVYGRIKKSNRQAISFDVALGFDVVGEIPQAFGPGENCVIVSMTRSKCRWIKE